MASAWGNSWGKAWGNSWGTITAAVTYGNLGFYDMGEEVRTGPKHKRKVKDDILFSMGEPVYIDEPIVEETMTTRKRVYDETDDLESILWLIH